MKIITNTASLFTQEEGRQLGISIIPVTVSLGGKSLRDYIDISPDEYVKLLHGDEIPVSSQPSVGDMMDQLENIDEEAIMLTVADGLSGEYSTAMGLRSSLPNKDNIYIINSRSLAGPLRYMARKAAKLKDQGLSAAEIAAQMQLCNHGDVEKSETVVVGTVGTFPQSAFDFSPDSHPWHHGEPFGKIAV